MTEIKTAAGQSSFNWFLVALAGALLSAPNALMVRVAVGDVNPLLVNALRFLLVALVCSPWIWRSRRLLTKSRLKSIMKAGVYLTIAVSGFVASVKLSQASYAAIIALLTPIILLVYSVRLYGEHLSQRTVTGISLAGMGALVLVALPFAQAGGAAFYPMATVMMLLNCFVYPLAIFEFKKLNEGGMPMTVIIGSSAVVVAVLSFMMLLFSGAPVTMPSGGHWLSIGYSGLAVALMGRMCKVWSIEKVGTGVTSAVMYLETFLGIVLPVLVLHEKLSSATLIGGALVLFGVYTVESHKHLIHHHRHIWRAH